MLARLGSLPSPVKLAKDNADVLKAIQAHKDRLYRVITRTAQFMLSFDSQHDSRISCGWSMSVVANASVESRKRLVRIMSHPRVQPIDLQFLLGQRIWTKDMLSILKLILTISGWSTISF